LQQKKTTSAIARSLGQERGRSGWGSFLQSERSEEPCLRFLVDFRKLIRAGLPSSFLTTPFLWSFSTSSRQDHSCHHDSSIGIESLFISPYFRPPMFTTKGRALCGISDFFCSVGHAAPAWSKISKPNGSQTRRQQTTLRSSPSITQSCRGPCGKPPLDLKGGHKHVEITTLHRTWSPDSVILRDLIAARSAHSGANYRSDLASQGRFWPGIRPDPLSFWPDKDGTSSCAGRLSAADIRLTQAYNATINSSQAHMSMWLPVMVPSP